MYLQKNNLHNDAIRVLRIAYISTAISHSVCGWLEQETKSIQLSEKANTSKDPTFFQHCELRSLPFRSVTAVESQKTSESYATMPESTRCATAAVVILIIVKFAAANASNATCRSTEAAENPLEQGNLKTCKPDPQALATPGSLAFLGPGGTGGMATDTDLTLMAVKLANGEPPGLSENDRLKLLGITVRAACMAEGDTIDISGLPDVSMELEERQEIDLLRAAYGCKTPDFEKALPFAKAYLSAYCKGDLTKFREALIEITRADKRRSVRAKDLVDADRTFSSCAELERIKVVTEPVATFGILALTNCTDITEVDEEAKSLAEAYEHYEDLVVGPYGTGAMQRGALEEAVGFASLQSRTNVAKGFDQVIYGLQTAVFSDKLECTGMRAAATLCSSRARVLGASGAATGGCEATVGL